MRVIRSADYRRMKWKNGGGETIEIAVSPPGASLDDFHWRLSMAHVATAGAFSIFPAVDRTLAVIEGAGVVLEVAGRGVVRLGRDAAPFTFPADLPVEATLMGGPIDDINIMTRRGRYRHLLSRLRIDDAIVLPRHGDIMIVLARLSGAKVRSGRRSEVLSAQDTVFLDDDDRAKVEIIPDAAAELFVIDLWRD